VNVTWDSDRVAFVDAATAPAGVGGGVEWRRWRIMDDFATREWFSWTRGGKRNIYQVTRGGARIWYVPERISAYQYENNNNLHLLFTTYQ